MYNSLNVHQKKQSQLSKKLCKVITMQPATQEVVGGFNPFEKY